MHISVEWIGVIVALFVGLISMLLAWKTNTTLERIKLFEFKHAIYIEVLEELSKADVGMNCNYTRLVAACYKARLFLPKKAGNDLMDVVAKVQVKQNTINEQMRNNPTQKDYERVERLNREIRSLVDIAIESMSKTIGHKKRITNR